MKRSRRILAAIGVAILAIVAIVSAPRLAATAGASAPAGSPSGRARPQYTPRASSSSSASSSSPASSSSSSASSSSTPRCGKPTGPPWWAYLGGAISLAAFEASVVAGTWAYGYRSDGRCGWYKVK